MTMKGVVKTYGGFLLEAVVFISIVYLCLQQGYLQLIGTKMPVEEKDYHTYTDFSEHYYAETQKAMPVIGYTTGSLDTGVYQLFDLIEAYDYAGEKLSLNVHSILNPKKEAVLWSGEGEQIEFEMPGVYIVTVSAADDGNRRSVCTIKIPVNSRKEAQ